MGSNCSKTHSTESTQPESTITIESCTKCEQRLLRSLKERERDLNDKYVAIPLIKSEYEKEKECTLLLKAEITIKKDALQALIVERTRLEIEMIE